jgi:Spy/CpxP family protein refolding chaperone
MNTKFLTLIAAGGLVVAGLTSQLLAADNASGAVPHGRFFQRIADRLNLTTDQRQQIKSILVSDHDTLQSLLGRLHAARIDLRAAIRATDASESSVRAASAKVAGAEADLAVERMKLYGRIAPILTDEQRQKITLLEETADAFVDNAIAQIGAGLN